jgi:hypothetical protein
MLAFLTLPLHVIFTTDVVIRYIFAITIDYFVKVHSVTLPITTFSQPSLMYFLSPSALRSNSFFSAPLAFVTKAVPFVKSHSSAKHVVTRKRQI